MSFVNYKELYPRLSYYLTVNRNSREREVMTADMTAHTEKYSRRSAINFCRNRYTENLLTRRV